MKTLGLLRHAKSSWDDPALADFDRPLNPRGRKAAALMGAEMRRRAQTFDLAIASPARRVAETIERVEAELPAPLDLRIEPSIYEASSDRLLQLVRSAGDEIGSLLLVGHNPGLQRLAMSLASADDRALGEVARSYPTGALLLPQFRCDGWRGVEAGTGRISLFLKPREIAQD